jgi:glycosyltransferase involved in cell wall biosynthesis
MAPYALALGGVPALLEDLELSIFRDQLRDASLSRRLHAQLTWFKLSAYLRRILPRFGACTVVSEGERGHVRLAAPGYDRVSIVPNAVDLGTYDGVFGQPRANTAVFSGALTYGPNLDAMQTFVKDIHPLIRRAVPDFQLQITGGTGGIDVADLLQQPGVELTGHLADIRPTVAQSWMSVVPLRLGGGTRLKILEAMALGTPVVSTSKGADGLGVTDRRDILLADEPSVFAARVVELLGSYELRQRIGAGGRRLVESTYDWQLVGQNLNHLLEWVASRRAA